VLKDTADSVGDHTQMIAYVLIERVLQIHPTRLRKLAIGRLQPVEFLGAKVALKRARNIFR